MPGFLRPGEEAELLALLKGLSYNQVRMHGVVAKRGVIHYGWDYDYEGWRILPAPPAPARKAWARCWSRGRFTFWTGRLAAGGSTCCRP